MLIKSQYDDYRAVVANGLANPDYITEWEVGFLTDYDAKFKRFGMNTFVTLSQDAIFERIGKTLRDALGSDYAKS